jgi:uncharacterized membrane protein YkoI
VLIGNKKQEEIKMKKKVIVGALSAVLVLGGAIAVTASKNDTQPDDKYTAITVNTENLTQKKEGQEVDGVTFYKIESDDDSRTATALLTTNTSAISAEEAAKIATNEVNGKVTEIEKEIEHGRLEYKFEIQSNRGDAEVRVDAESGKITRVEFDDNDDDFRDDDNYDDKDDDDGYDD